MNTVQVSTHPAATATAARPAAVAAISTASRLPRNPLALGLLWEFQDGYLAGPPAPLQRLVFGGSAAPARRTGYARRLRTGAGQG
ncbi:hypothetical protein ACIGO9_36365 [Nocardia asteroides]|uniref:hypothetical protein n=1 Tax=Nocardia asteroides TaxID=1824 RepID=UPI0037C8F286